MDPPFETCGRVFPDNDIAFERSESRLAPPPVVDPSPSVIGFTESKTVVSTSVCELLPSPGTMPPCIPRAVVFPPASPTYEERIRNLESSCLVEKQVIQLKQPSRDQQQEGMPRVHRGKFWIAFLKSRLGYWFNDLNASSEYESIVRFWSKELKR